MNPRIVGIAGPFRGDVFPLRDADVSIGRESSNDLCITDAALSRRHCLLMPKSEQFAIRDLGSRNGTRVNGVPVDEQLLSHGDQIAIGSSLLIFLLEEDELHLERNPVELTKRQRSGTLHFYFDQKMACTDDRIAGLQPCRKQPEWPAI